LTSFSGIAEVVKLEKQISHVPFSLKEKGRMRGLE
jgi:hypothetical protein